MSQLVPLDIPPGLNTDDTTFAARGRWADCNNVRFWHGKPQVRGGFTTLGVLGSGTRCNAIAVFKIADGTQKWVFGTTSVLWGETAGTMPSGASDDITPSGLTGSITSWSMAAWGHTLMVCPQRSGVGDTIYQWVPASGDAAAVTNAPAQVTYMGVAKQRQLIAFGCNETGGTFNGMCIRGSDLEDETDWTPSSANNSFEDILEGGGTRIVAARPIGDGWAVWTDKSLFHGTFIGDPTKTWDWAKVSDNAGLIGPNAATIVDGAAYWLRPDLVPTAWTPGTLPQAIPCPILNDFQAAHGANDQSAVFPTKDIVASVPQFQEIHFYYPTTTTGPPTDYIAVSLVGQGWWKGDLDRTAILEAPEYRAADVGGAPYVAANGLTIVAEENGANTGVTASLQSADVYFDESRRRVMVRSIYPDFEDQTSFVTLTLFSRNHPNSQTVTTHTAQTLEIATAKKDFRASGKIFAVKFSSGANVGWRLGKPLFDVVTLGER